MAPFDGRHRKYLSMHDPLLQRPFQGRRQHFEITLKDLEDCHVGLRTHAQRAGFGATGLELYTYSIVWLLFGVALLALGIRSGDEVITQARRLTKPPYHAQYQVIMSDVWGADGSQPGIDEFEAWTVGEPGQQAGQRPRQHAHACAMYALHALRSALKCRSNAENVSQDLAA
jgi:hypothetical protein